MTPEISNENEDKQLEKISIEIEKLRAETANLKSIIRFVPIVTGTVAALAFCFGIWQYNSQQKEKVNQQKQDAAQSQENFNNNVKLSEKEFRRKFYEKQLEIYLDLSQTASQVSTLKDNNKIQERYQHFLEVYNGNLIIVNTDKDCDNKVQTAADNFKNSFEHNHQVENLKDSAKHLSMALRHSLKCFWEIPIDKI